MGQNTQKTAEIIDITKIGKGLRLKEKKTIMLNRELATWLLEQVEDFVAERPLRQRHVNYLAEQMERGSFLPEQVTIVVCELPDGRMVRMNGQHTSWAILEFKDEEAKAYEVNFMTYEADTEEDMRRLYASLDRGTPRTQDHVVRSYLVGSEHFGGLNGREIKMLSGGFAWYYWPMSHDRGKHGGDDIAVLLSTDYLDLALRVAEVVKGLDKKRDAHLYRVAVIGAIFATVLKAPKIAAEFWARVADGLGLDSAQDPRYKLREFLISTAVRSQSGVSAGKRAVPGEDMYRACIAAWNAHRANKLVQHFKPSAMTARPKVK